MTTANPLLDPAPSEVPLAHAPLANVLCAVSFPAILKILDPSGASIAPFQEAVRRDYPTLTQETEHAFSFQFDEKGGVAPQAVANTVWRFLDRDKKWRVSLSRDVLALETQQSYTSRTEFLRHFERLTDAFIEAFDPASCTRVGVRYVNVIGGKHLAKLSKFVRPEFRSFGTPPFLEHLTVCNQGAEFAVPEGRLIVRSGILKPGQSHDPNTLAPAEDERYFLDLDANNNVAQDFTTPGIRASVTELSERAYSMFRGAVTDAFLEACNA